ncbi:sulfite exporter TauE/SafE family protein [Mycobacterium sp. PS03-16]|uniref:sulfite exporter TauE/SafE family protein n=1 Tax=Mycobacterium sp. PS03-16 TaxID=2559611 RepID=UPI0010740A64|nr:sulfite exporter TauE/SafE family protein [Mycobacterium sp. PS03-16]TFV60057.1 sulfite exporter TauE/SafE family protein [Mycobacterium sp. PS03-16]
MSIASYSIIAAAIVLASCMQASIGFGMGMLAAPIVAIVDPALIPATLIMLATILTLFVVIREHQAIDIRGTGWALAGRIPGTVAGALLLAAMPEQMLALALAGVVLLGVVFASAGWKPAPHKRNLVVAGAASGVLGTATSIGGPPMALVWQGSTGPALRGTMNGFFLIGSVISVGVLALTGEVHETTLRAFALMLPAVVVGYLLSRLMNRVLDRRRQRWLAIGVSTVGAVVLIARQLGAF